MENYDADTKWLISIITIIMQGPPFASQYSLGTLLGLLDQFRAAAGYIKYHQVHLMLLDQVVTIFDEFQPINNEIDSLERNIIAYRNDASKVVFNMEKLLSRRLYQAVGKNQRILLVGFAKSHPDFVTKWNNYLDVLKGSLKVAFEVCSYLIDQGRMIVRDTQPKIDDLKEKLDNIREEYVLERVGKFQYRNKIDMIELILLPTVSKTKTSIEDASKKLIILLNEISAIEKLEL